MVFNKEERKVQVTCEVSKELKGKLDKIRKEKGKRISWLVKTTIEKFNKGELSV